MTRAALLMAVILWPAPSPVEPQGITGYASAYAPGVMESTVEYRFTHGVWWHTPPRNWYEVAGYIATNDCAQVGQTMTLIDPAGRAYRVLVADCGGDDGGAEFMTRNNIVAELDWRLWERLTDEHGRPLEIELRN